MAFTAEQITKLREQKGWSKSKLAREAELNPSTISNIESGRLVPYPVQLEKIANALGVDVSELVEVV